jgi:hypothetical protein
VYEAKGNVVSAAIARRKLEDIEAVAPKAGPAASVGVGSWRPRRCLALSQKEVGRRDWRQ